MADIDVDFWQTFDFTTLDTTNLAANDNNAGGTWTITDPSTRLSTTTSAEKLLAGTVDGVSDASGTRGLRYDSATDFVEGFITYAFASSHADLSFGFWFRFPAEYVGSFEGGQPDILYIENATATREFYIKLWDDGSSHLVLFTPEQGYSTNIDVSPDTWYWITGRYFTTHSLRVYNDSGAQVGSEVTRTGTSTAATQATMGDLIGDEGGGGPFDFDDWIIDWTDATFPLGPGVGGTTIAVAQGTPTISGTVSVLGKAILMPDEV